MTRNRIGLIVLVLVCSMPGMASAIIVDPGYNYLPADTLATFPILVYGYDPVQYADLWLQIGDGGPFLGGTQTHPQVPVITDVSLTGPGTIFAGNNCGQAGTSTGLNNTYPDFFAYESVITASGSVNSRGILAWVTVDTTGAVHGSQFPLMLELPSVGARTEVGVSLITEILPGYVQIMPEPSTLALLGSAVLVACRRVKN